ncbi:MAG: hypothetical protein R2746_07475 [Acidimicrobiales bacterium]
MRLSDLPLALLEVDLLLTSTGATVPVVEHDDFEPVMAERAGRPLLIVDIAVPRDVDPTVRTLPGVTLLDINDLRTFAQAGVERRAHELAAVEEIIDDEISRFRTAASARSAAPVVGAAPLGRRGPRRRARPLRRSARGARRPPAATVEALAKGLVQKLLHRPSIALKEHAGTPTGDRLAEAMRQLYDLDG